MCVRAVVLGVLLKLGQISEKTNMEFRLSNLHALVYIWAAKKLRSRFLSSHVVPTPMTVDFAFLQPPAGVTCPSHHFLRINYQHLRESMFNAMYRIFSRFPFASTRNSSNNSWFVPNWIVLLIWLPLLSLQTLSLSQFWPAVMLPVFVCSLCFEGLFLCVSCLRKRLFVFSDSILNGK